MNKFVLVLFLRNTDCSITNIQLEGSINNIEIHYLAE